MLLICLLCGCSTAPVNLYYSKQYGLIELGRGVNPPVSMIKPKPVQITPEEKSDLQLFTNSVILVPQRVKREEIVRFSACGPIAISEAAHHFKIEISPKEVSEYIQHNNPAGDILRDSFALVHYEALSITWPWEISPTLNHYGITTTESDGNEFILRHLIVEMGKKRECAIVLVQKRGMRNYHYQYFDDPADAANVFDNDTVVLRVFALHIFSHPPVLRSVK